MFRFIIVLLAIALPACAGERLNILFVFADDWGRYASAYAAVDGRPSLNDVIKTPSVDRVAREGVLFRHAFVNAPSCTPCRSSLLSGRFFFNTGRGAILSGAVWDSAIPVFPLMLHDAGYHIGCKRARVCCLHALGELLAVLHAENQCIDRQRQRVAVCQNRRVDFEFAQRRRNPSARA